MNITTGNTTALENYKTIEGLNRPRNQRLEATSGGDAICITELLRITTHKAANTGPENLLTTITRRSDDGHR